MVSLRLHLPAPVLHYCVAIKTHSSPPPLFQQLSPSLLCSPPLSHILCTAPSCLRPHRAPLTPLLQNRYDAASGKHVAARRLTLIRSTPRQHFLVDPLTCVSTPDSDAGEASGVPAGRRRL